MSQHDYVIGNDTAANVRADINTALLAIASNNSGASAPATTYANQWWYDSTNDILKIRSEANDAWISIAKLNQTSKQFFPIVGGVEVTATGTELNYTDGVTSAIQTQLDAKAALASPPLTGTPTAPTATAGTNTTQIATTAFVLANGGVAGEVSFFAMSSAPTGWLKANGAEVSRSTYAALFTAIGTTFGVGNGSTTFNIPDLRGEFIRGWDDARGIDSGRAFGSAQANDTEAHTHGAGTLAWTKNLATASAQSTSGITGGTGASGSGPYNISLTGITSSTGGTETRPRNIALLACIKF